MELIRIGSGKLKIMLSEDDMHKYDLEASTADYNTTATRRAFWSILDDAKIRTGFDAACDRVFIQMFPSFDGGCEMFVTKMSDFQDLEEESPKPKPLCFLFRNTADLLDALSRLSAERFRGDSALFLSEKGTYYLFVTEKAKRKKKSDLEKIFLTEYGKETDAAEALLYIREHGKCLAAERAVEILSKLR